MLNRDFFSSARFGLDKAYCISLRLELAMPLTTRLRNSFLHRAHRDARGEALLKDEEQHDYWHGGDHGSRLIVFPRAGP
jgi:hypothetical protein